MDLDFSFALVSSLTPRRKIEKTSPARSTTKTKLLKTKSNLPFKSQNPEEVSHKKKEDKENLIPKEQLMSKDEFLKPVENKRNSNLSDEIHRRQSVLSSFSINMENIAVRRNQTRRRKQIEANRLKPCNNVLENSHENLVGDSNIPSERVNLPICVTDVINISSDIDEDFDNNQLDKVKVKYVSRKSPRFNRVSDSSVRSSLEVIESSCSETKGDLFGNEKNNRRNLRSLTSKNSSVRTRSTRISGLSETSLSTAYDSDSFQAVRRNGTKVIPETPESDKSSGESLNNKSKSSILNFSLEENKKTHKLRCCDNESPIQNSTAKRKSSEISGSPDENKKRYSIGSSQSGVRPKRKSSLLSSIPDKNKPADEIDILTGGSHGSKQLETKITACRNPVFSKPSKPLSQNKEEVGLQKRLRADGDRTLDMFSLESTIKEKPLPCEIKTELDESNVGSTAGHTHNDQQANNIARVSKGRNTKQQGIKDSGLTKKKNKTKQKEISDLKNVSNQTIGGNCETNLRRTKNEHSSPNSLKISSLVLPTEIIPKFEHINQWLKGTQENTFSSLECDSTAHNRISMKDVIPVKKQYKVSLSPRIKKKKEKAKSSLEEEQKLFEELYGAGCNKRFSDDADEVGSTTSCRDSVEFSENVLDKLYGTVWQKDTAVTRSEPRKGKKKNTKNKTPLTER